MMIFDNFPDLQRALEFAAAAEKKFGLQIVVFSDSDSSLGFNPVPFDQTAPIVHVERVDVEDVSIIAAIKRRFGLSSQEVKAEGIYSAETMTVVAAEARVEKMAKAFGGTFLCT